MQYEIFEGNMERLEKKLFRICNKCKAYGCEFTYHRTGETFKEITSETGRNSSSRALQISRSRNDIGQQNRYASIASLIVCENTPIL